MGSLGIGHLTIWHWLIVVAVVLLVTGVHRQCALHVYLRRGGIAGVLVFTGPDA